MVLVASFERLEVHWDQRVASTDNLYAFQFSGTQWGYKGIINSATDSCPEISHGIHTKDSKICGSRISQQTTPRFNNSEICFRCGKLLTETFYFSFTSRTFFYCISACARFLAWRDHLIYLLAWGFPRPYFIHCIFQSNIIDFKQLLLYLNIR